MSHPSSTKTYKPPPAVYLPAHPFGTPPERVHATPPLHQKNHIAPSCLPTDEPIWYTPGASHATNPVKSNTHVARNRLPNGAPISCISRVSPRHYFSAPEPPHRPQLSIYRCTQLV